MSGKGNERLIDGWERRATMGSFIWTMPTWVEEPKIERHQSRLARLVTHPVPCKGTQHRGIIGKLVNDAIMSGVQTLVTKSHQEASIMDGKNAPNRELRDIEGFKVMPEVSQVLLTRASETEEFSQGVASIRRVGGVPAD